MKKILLLMALAGFTAAGSYAQNKNCSVTHKVTTKKVIRKTSDKPLPTCFMLKKENFGIPGCTDVTYGTDKDYLGYYATKTTAVPARIAKAREAAVKTTYPVPQERPIFKKAEQEPMIPCYTYSKNNIVVKECPSDFYNSDEWPNTAPIEYNSDNTYMGNYPKTEDVNNANNSVENKPMEDRPIEGLNLPGNNLYFWGNYNIK